MIDIKHFAIEDIARARIRRYKFADLLFASNLFKRESCDTETLANGNATTRYLRILTLYCQ